MAAKPALPASVTFSPFGCPPDKGYAHALPGSAAYRVRAALGEFPEILRCPCGGA